METITNSDYGFVFSKLLKVKTIFWTWAAAMKVFYTGEGKSKFTVVSMQNIEFIFLLLFINYCTIYCITSNCKPTVAHLIYDYEGVVTLIFLGSP